MAFQWMLIFCGLSVRGAVAPQPGALDMDYNANPAPYQTYDPAAILVQRDGKIVLPGFYTVNGINISNRVLRLTTAGGLDDSFQPGEAANANIRCGILDSEERFLVGGQFTRIGGQPRSKLARLKSDGSLDPDFWSQGAIEGGAAYIDAIALQKDGKILIAGSFTHVDGIPSRAVARLKPDGAVDESFSSGPNNNAPVSDVAVQEDGKILFGGVFTRFAGVERQYITRVDENGKADQSFKPGAGPDGFLSGIVIQRDGMILVYGQFTTFAGAYRPGIVRLKPDGSLDPGFRAGTGLGGRDVQAVVVEEGGKILIGGNFTFVTSDRLSRARIARLHTDGSLDTSFDPGLGATFAGLIGAVPPRVDDLALAPGGIIYIGGYFREYDGQHRRGFARIYGGDFALEVPGLNVVSPAEAAFSCRFDTLLGKRYTLEYKTELDSETWISLPTVEGTGGAATFTDPQATVGQRFYRMRCE